jgi:PAS domain S-box-containing protein
MNNKININEIPYIVIICEFIFNNTGEIIDILYKELNKMAGEEIQKLNINIKDKKMLADRPKKIDINEVFDFFNKIKKGFSEGCDISDEIYIDYCNRKYRYKVKYSKNIKEDFYLFFEINEENILYKMGSNKLKELNEIYTWTYRKHKKKFDIDKKLKKELGVQEYSGPKLLNRAAKTIYGSDWTKLRRAIVKLRNEGKIDVQIRMFIPSKNKYCWMHVKGYLVNPKSKHMIVTGTIQNISLYKDEEDKILKLGLEYDAFFEGVEDLLVLVDVSVKGYKIIRVNKSFERSIRQSRDELEGLLISNIDSEELSEFIKRNLERTILYKRKHKSEIRTDKIAGYMQNWRVRFTPVFKNKKVESVLITLIDVTEKRIVEFNRQETMKQLKELKSVINTSRVFVFSLGKKGLKNILYFSDNIKTFGYQAEEIINEPEIFEEIIYKEDRKKVYMNHSKLDDSGVMKFGQVFRMQSWDGKVYWIQEQVIVERNHYGRAVAFHGVLIDLTDNPKVESINSNAREQMQQLFLNKISQELRTPLNGIFGMIQLLKFTDISKDQVRYLNNLEISSKRLTEIIEDLLEVSEIEKENRVIDRVDFGFKDVVQNLDDKFRYFAEEKELKLNLILSSQIPDTLNGDLRKVMRICTHLLDNAIKFTDKGGILFEIKFLKQNNEEVWIEIVVQDTGLGVDEREHEKIFEPFYQSKQNIKKNVRGVGLGLAICRDIAILLNGEISVYSRLNSGTQICVKLPFQRTEINVVKKVNEINQNKKEIKILLAEDDPINQISICELLKKKNWKVDVVENGKEALERLIESHYDAILMDISMPIMNGIETTKIIRKKEKENNAEHISIIALTAHASKEDEITCIDSGMDAYISKPINAPLLYSKIENLVFNRKA